MKRAIKIGVKDVSDKLAGVGKGVTGLVTGNRELRDEARAQLDQAHVEPEAAAVDAEEGGASDAPS
ncbi:MAG: hypothetical protein ACTHOG_03495 [Marmoricola sp.]